MNWYNENLKKDFISQYTGEVAQNTFKLLFSKAAQMEFLLEKDCSQFTLDEIMDLARSFGASDMSSIKHKMSLLRTYTNFCINSGFHNTGINHYEELHSKVYEELIDVRKAAQTYISREEVEDIISRFDNARDKYIILAPYEDIYGKDLCELLQLSKHDLLGSNKLKLCTGREITVSSELYHIIEDCIDSDVVYYSGRRRELENTDLVYRNIKMKTADASNSSIVKKFFKLKTYLGRETFGLRMLYVSGFMNGVRAAVEKHGSLDEAREDIVALQEQYQNSYSFANIKIKYDEMMFVTNAVSK